MGIERKNRITTRILVVIVKSTHLGGFRGKEI
jgi:hypothetical protein